ncbi:MAG: hypothetical protein KGO50_04025 [Myxococcales bacterium]|nr:hypothetical protein [Myxococcales bacterium]
MSATLPEPTFEAASGDELLDLQEWSMGTLGPAMSLATGEDILQGIRSLLRVRMDELLRGSRVQLQQALYRFDVDERKVRDAFASVDPNRLPDTLAELVLQRALAKIRSRRRWAGHFDVP